MKLGPSLLCFLHIIHGFYCNIELTCGTVNPLLPANVTCVCQYLGNGISWFHPNGSKLVNCFQSSQQCLPTINGFMFSIDSASLYRMTIINYRYSDCLYFSCRDISDSTIQKSARPSPSEFDSTTPVSLNEPNSNHSNGTITFTTACVFQYSKINYTWYIVKDGTETEYAIGPEKSVFESNSSSCKQCTGDTLASLTIGFNHIEAVGKGARTVLFQVKIHHEDYPSDFINLTSKHAYSVQVNEHRETTSGNADDTIYYIAIPVVCVLLIGCVIGIHCYRKSICKTICKTKTNTDEIETPLSPKCRTKSNDFDDGKKDGSPNISGDQLQGHDKDDKFLNDNGNDSKDKPREIQNTHHHSETPASDSGKLNVKPEIICSTENNPNGSEDKPQRTNNDGEDVHPNTPAETDHHSDTPANDSVKIQGKPDIPCSMESHPNGSEDKPQRTNNDGEHVHPNTPAETDHHLETPANDSVKIQGKPDIPCSKASNPNGSEDKPQRTNTDKEDVHPNTPAETDHHLETPASDSGKLNVKPEIQCSTEINPNGSEDKPQRTNYDWEHVHPNTPAETDHHSETPASDSGKLNVKPEIQCSKENNPNGREDKPQRIYNDGEEVHQNTFAETDNHLETPAKNSDCGENGENKT